MNTINSMEFAQLLASRICHDLISPVAAVNNGIELLLDDTDDDSDSRKSALELIDDSAKMAAVKLKLMRAAFGAGQVLSDNASMNDLLGLLNPIAEKNKVNIVWENPDNHYFHLTQSRLILNVMLILLESLPRGGNINMTTTDEKIEWRVTSEKLIFSDEKIAYLSGTQTVPVEPRYIGFVVVQLLAGTQKFNVNKIDNHLTINLNW